MAYPKILKFKKVYFSCPDVSRGLGITLESARVACSRLTKSGLLVRPKRNLYILKERWDAFSREEKFTLANLMQVPSYVSLMTALDYYELTTQVQRDFIESVCIYRTREVGVEENIFKYVKINRGLYFGFAREKGYFIAFPEKALLDALYLMSLKRYSFDLSSIDFRKFDTKALKRMAKKFPAKTQELLKRAWKA